MSCHSDPERSEGEESRSDPFFVNPTRSRTRFLFARNDTAAAPATAFLGLWYCVSYRPRLTTQAAASLPHSKARSIYSAVLLKSPRVTQFTASGKNTNTNEKN